MRRYFDAPSPAAQRAPRQHRPLGRYRFVRLRWRALFAIIDWLGEWIASRASRHAVLRNGSVWPRVPRSILLVQLDHLGDAVISTAMLEPLRRRYPGARIEVLAGAWNCELFRNCEQVDAVHVSRVNRFARRGGALWAPALLYWGLTLRRRRFDWAVDVRGELPLALLLWLTGARRRVGWNCGGGGFLLTDSPAFVPERPEVDSRRALLELLDADGTELTPRVRPDAATLRRVARELVPVRVAHRPLFVLHIGAGTQAKRWPVAHWRELVCRLIVDHGARIVLVGDEREGRLARSIQDGTPQEDVHDWTGRSGIVSLAALLAQCDLVIGADSGPAHLAAAVGTPVVVIFSGTNHVEQWRPWGPDVFVVRQAMACSPCHLTRCIWADHPCMTQLAPGQVARAVDRAEAVWRPRLERGAEQREAFLFASSRELPWIASNAMAFKPHEEL